MLTWLVGAGSSLAITLQLHQVSCEEQAPAEHSRLDLNDVASIGRAAVLMLTRISSCTAALVPPLQTQMHCVCGQGFEGVLA